MVAASTGLAAPEKRTTGHASAWIARFQTINLVRRRWRFQRSGQHGVSWHHRKRSLGNPKVPSLGPSDCPKPAETTPYSCDTTTTHKPKRSLRSGDQSPQETVMAIKKSVDSPPSFPVAPTRTTHFLRGNTGDAYLYLPFSLFWTTNVQWF